MLERRCEVYNIETLTQTQDPYHIYLMKILSETIDTWLHIMLASILIINNFQSLLAT